MQGGHQVDLANRLCRTCRIANTARRRVSTPAGPFCLKHRCKQLLLLRGTILAIRDDRAWVANLPASAGL